MDRGSPAFAHLGIEHLRISLANPPSKKSEVRNCSFVVIARNEEGALARCLDSILRLDMANCEVICVDSRSTDRTTSIMRHYARHHEIITVLANPECRNAACARNEGIEASTKEILFFIDGDIELNPEFVRIALEELAKPDRFAVTGGLDEVIYRDHARKNRVRERVRKHFPVPQELIGGWGGIYAAKREAIEKTGFYDERFHRQQDLEYALRLTNQFPLVALPVSMGTHHTGEYRDRIVHHFVKGHMLLHGMMARKHFWKKDFWPYWFRTRKNYVFGGMATGMLILLWLAHFQASFPWPIPTAFTVLFLGYEIHHSIKHDESFLTTIVKHWLTPYAIVLGFLIEPFVHSKKKGAS
jgi:glycosyltransferase involved in cell wall biosynthesis